MSLFNQHANERYHERISPDISKREIQRAIDNKQVQFFQRATESKSKVYISTDKGIVKAVISKKTKQVVTFLPWQDEYKKELKLFHPQYGEFKAILYPDCYLETGVSMTLNKIFLNGSEAHLSPASDKFQELFNFAWGYYETQIKNKKETA
jgi:methionine synthase II (cobalamin-independent)